MTGTIVQKLRAISGLGLEDNTGLGLSVMEANGVVEVRQLKKNGWAQHLIKGAPGHGHKICPHIALWQ